ncbi:hypothetical protein I350_01560 [Cryptococcus amylolentus CBS 6273]|uniref:Septin-type G domain-containing protein n=1 Tax=Cryptococcus amylolentus CBS 6273 TaxID=1296118 RepID=A0A1E3KCX7_9TREE|nr:hypothetical protein I350_01560 [Cryptococcus amylolentus CBS 6273]
MPPSFLRKKPRHSNQTLAPKNPPAIRHSLSLPDLTTPLIDTSSWEEVPPFTFSAQGDSPVSPRGPGSPVSPVCRSSGTRNRKPSMVGGRGGEVQFHRPFTPKLVINSSPHNVSWGGDFRVSAAQWGRDASGKHAGQAQGQGLGRPDVRQSMASVASRRKSRKKGAAEKMNVVVAGGKGVGKTSQVANLIHDYRILLRLIDTPGLELCPDEDLVGGIAAETALGHGVGVKGKERERGVKGLLRILEERFKYTLREESKVQRRVGADEGLVHLVIYLIDAREVLRPEEARKPTQEVDWSCVGLFDDESLQDPDHEQTDTETSTFGPNLSSIEIDIIDRLSIRANVLPIISRTDTLTVSELEAVKAAVQRDLSAAFSKTPGRGFGVFGSDEESLSDSTNIKEEDMEVDQPDPRPPTPNSIHSTASLSAPGLPWSIFIPSPSVSGGPEVTAGVRQFPWGTATVLEPEHSHFGLLLDNILGDYTKVLRNRTREVLYENYRTERLLAESQGN